MLTLIFTNALSRNCHESKFYTKITNHRKVFLTLHFCLNALQPELCFNKTLQLLEEILEYKSSVRTSKPWPLDHFQMAS